MLFSIKDIQIIIDKIEANYSTHPTESNQGDCLDAKDGFELLIDELKKIK